MEDMRNGPDKIAVYKLHKSFGLTVLALMLFRIAWRWQERQRPALPPMPAWQRLTASALHVLLYVCALVMPISGWLYNSAANFPLRWFELFKVPALSGADPALKSLAGNVHGFTAYLLIGLLCLHVAAALKHHFIDRDNVLRAMLPWKRSGPAAEPIPEPAPPPPVSPPENAP
jgi:cytochrome b561